MKKIHSSVLTFTKTTRYTEIKPALAMSDNGCPDISVQANVSLTNIKCRYVKHVAYFNRFTTHESLVRTGMLVYVWKITA